MSRRIPRPNLLRRESEADPLAESKVAGMMAKLQQRMNRNQAVAAPSDAVLVAPTPRGSLPNSLGVQSTMAAESVSGMLPENPSLGEQAQQPLLPLSEPLSWPDHLKVGYGRRSACLRYAIALVRVNGVEQFEVRRRVPGNPELKIPDSYVTVAVQQPTYAAARGVAQRDYDARHEIPVDRDASRM
jgi:hypothetical protein